MPPKKRASFLAVVGAALMAAPTTFAQDTTICPATRSYALLRYNSSMNVKPPYIGFYGDVGILKAYCHGCRSYAFVIDGLISCCGIPYESQEPVRKMKQESEGAGRKQGPSTSARKKILEQQDFRCIYCQLRFDSTILYNGEPRTVKVNWDHFVPYSYSRSNRDTNFVAACSICNGIKGSLMFDDLIDARIYITNEREKRVQQISSMRELPQRVSAITPASAVL